jgi:hypothetical protein
MFRKLAVALVAASVAALPLTAVAKTTTKQPTHAANVTKPVKSTKTAHATTKSHTAKTSSKHVASKHASTKHAASKTKSANKHVAKHKPTTKPTSTKHAAL